MVKSTNRQNLDLEAKIKKSKTALFSETLKLPENEVISCVSFSAYRLPINFNLI